MKRIVAATILFGSIWGLLECSVGDFLHKYNSSYIMTIMAISLMAVTRHVYKSKGMQAAMALIAASLRHFNPIGGCLICASISIAIEGIIFEAIWLLPWKKYESYTMKVSMGIISFYLIYAIGYISTQILTPFIFSKFYLRDLLAIIPRILSRSSIVGIVGGVIHPLTYMEIRFKIDDRLFYTASAAITAVCWLAIIYGI